MEVKFFVRPTLSQGQEWRSDETWSCVECVPRKGELVKVTAIATDGARVKREMRVLEVCHVDPGHAEVWLVPTNVKV